MLGFGFNREGICFGDKMNFLFLTAAKYTTMFEQSYAGFKKNAHTRRVYWAWNMDKTEFQ